ncbi:hypothetical protein E1A91_A05G390700v1 [Gossypium mustelinum]|uniref:Lipoyl-binding domain-containing protein n=1 Tax=Gossypium mustelinum TaxID=34275 RepID=A0A5D2ZHS9_GOSMU|nr:hypothetical protein E1A91_A05G390700v1 [Gossypium mustelinum]
MKPLAWKPSLVCSIGSFVLSKSQLLLLFMQQKQIVKEGQVLYYIGQLGCEILTASDVSREVIKILREDGDSIGYGDDLIAILSSFPGIKELQ